jgi:tight adherence protein C
MAAINPFLPYIIGAIALVIVIGLVAVGVAGRAETDPLQDRLAEFVATQAEDISSLEEIEMSVPFSQRVLLPIMQAVASLTQSFTPQEALEKTQHRIDLAGNPNGLTPPVFWAIRIVTTFGLLFLLGFVFTISGNLPPIQAVLFTVGGGVMGFILPPLWLSSKVSTRQNEIIKSLPDALDLMTICVEAGLGFDAAMTKVAEKWDNEMSVAFNRVIQEIQLGKLRREALRDMAASIDVADVTSFTASIIQADQLGVSLAKVLRIQADQMRIKRRQRAEEKAQQAPVKMVLPMVFFIFPTIYLVLLGPAAIQVFEQFGLGGI